MYLRGIKQETTIIMRKTTLILALLAAVVYGRAQDFLTPESYGIYSSNRHGNETLFQLLFPEHKSNNAVWEMEYKTFFLCAPSFSAEYALEIGDSELTFTKANQNIYMSLSRHLQECQPDPLKVVSVDVKKMSVPEETCERLSNLFKLATMTATHLENIPCGLDGTTYYFNHRRNLASVWEPENGRTARLVKMADSLCYAVSHHDTNVLNRQLEECKELTQEFKRALPDIYFKPIYSIFRRGNNTYWTCGTYCEDCIRFELANINVTNKDTCKMIASVYSDSLSAWSRELFLMSDRPEYPTVVLDKSCDTAFCEARTYENHTVRKITLSDKLWRRDVILSAAMLPPGRYYFEEGQWKKEE